uniref:Uncharacterized protein n=1 Tax=Rhizophora mucronata TaxID=61149 RepID=A0A2P2QE02_RHIMU
MMLGDHISKLFLSFEVPFKIFLCN